MSSMNAQYFAIAIKFAQIPLVCFITLLSFKAQQVLKIKELRWFGFAFAINLLYIISSLSSNYIQFIRGNLDNNPGLVADHATTVLRMLASYCFYRATIQWYYSNNLNAALEDIQKLSNKTIIRTILRKVTPCVPKDKKIADNINMIIIIAIIIIMSVDLLRHSAAFKIIDGIYGVGSVLLISTVFFNAAKKYNYAKNTFLSAFTLWGCVQFLAFFNDSILVQNIAYGSSLVAKSLILLALFSWYVEFATANERKALKEEEDKLNEKKLKEEVEKSSTFFKNILAGIFHELLIPMDSLGIAIEDTARFFPRDNRTKIELVESYYERVHAIIEISKEDYSEVEQVRDVFVDNENINTKKKIKIISINTLIEGSIKSISSRYKNIKFDVSYRPNCRLECFTSEIIQVFTNILKNSAESYQEKDDKEGLIKKEKTTHIIYIKTFLNKDRKKIIVEFEDNALGISPESMNDIWELGFSTKKIDSVNIVRGQGLYLVKKIMAKYEGSNISIDSPIKRRDGNIQAGTKFTLQFNHAQT